MSLLRVLATRVLVATDEASLTPLRFFVQQWSLCCGVELASRLYTPCQSCVVVAGRPDCGPEFG
jgi:hypothetical protein